MIKEQIKKDITKTILDLNSDISNYDRNKLINLLNSIVDYTNNTELEQKVTQLQQKHNELVETVEELETKLQTYSDKVDNLETRVQALENSSQS
ncbi:MAG: hemolysin [Bacteriophage sp.]|nr:MAG: hemolysin [Bacteriophage sp.]